MQREHTMSPLVITHEGASVMRVTSRMAVMYAGRLVEVGPTVSVVTDPRQPFTRALIDAVLTGDPARKGRRVVLGGEPPSPLAPPSGCALHPRCPHPLRDADCAHLVPPLAGKAVRRVACLKQ